MQLEKMKTLSSSIEVSALNFSYDDQIPIFANFSLMISPGSRCLLVGANGSGISILISNFFTSKT